MTPCALHLKCPALRVALTALSCLSTPFSFSLPHPQSPPFKLFQLLLLIQSLQLDVKFTWHSWLIRQCAVECEGRTWSRLAFRFLDFTAGTPIIPLSWMINTLLKSPFLILIIPSPMSPSIFLSLQHSHSSVCSSLPNFCSSDNRSAFSALVSS